MAKGIESAGNTLSRQEIDEKARRLALYGNSLSHEQIDRLTPRLWSIVEAEKIGRLV